MERAVSPRAPSVFVPGFIRVESGGDVEGHEGWFEWEIVLSRCDDRQLVGVLVCCTNCCATPARDIFTHIWAFPSYTQSVLTFLSFYIIFFGAFSRGCQINTCFRKISKNTSSATAPEEGAKKKTRQGQPPVSGLSCTLIDMPAAGVVSEKGALKESERLFLLPPLGRVSRGYQSGAFVERTLSDRKLRKLTTLYIVCI